MATLVLLPGLDGSGDFFEPLIEALPDGFDAIVVRYPGDQPLDYPGHVAFVNSQLPSGQPFVVVAESFSGPVAIMLAEKYPPGLLGVVLCATFAVNPHPALHGLRGLIPVLPVHSFPMSFLAWLLLRDEANPAWASRIKAALRRSSAAAIRARLASVLAVNVLPALGRIEAPMLYLQSSHDLMVPASSLRRIQETARSIEVRRIDGPHFLLQTRPVECADAIVSFTRRIAASQFA